MPYKDPEKQREYSRQYYKAYREKNKEKLSEQKREYREKNKEKLAEKQKEYYQTPHGKKRNRISNWKRIGILSEDYDALYERFIATEKCEFCGVDLSVDRYTKGTTRSLDHDHESGQVRGVLCHTCNRKDVLKI